MSCFAARGHRSVAGGVVSVAVLVAIAGSAFAQNAPAALAQPTAHRFRSVALEDVPTFVAPAMNPDTIADIEREDRTTGVAPRYAITNEVLITPDTHGVWEQVTDKLVMWRLRVTAENALSLNFGFTRYSMPEGGRLYIYETDVEQAVRPFTSADNADHGELWTPPSVGNDVIIEVTLPADVAHLLDLELGWVNTGFRGFLDIARQADKAGACNVDVVCPDGNGWEDEINSVAVISTGGGTFCTGFAVNNTAQDGRPLFMTAAHCGIGAGNAPSLVAFWNFQSPVCGRQSGGTLNQFSTGSTFRAGSTASDFTIVEFSQPFNPDFGVTFAGWDATGAEATTAVAIHHPNTDEKSISFEFQPTTTTSYLSNTVPGDGSHVRIIDWDTGTTEPGSSGSPVFDQNHRVIGQLHGGFAACGNNDSDWYGRISRSWNGGGTNASSLRPWLDPTNSGALTIDTLSNLPGRIGVTGDALAASGPIGGPFAPASITYTVRNTFDIPMPYTVTADVPWLNITNGSGTLAPDATANVTVAIDQADAAAFPAGIIEGAVAFTNLIDGNGNTTRDVTIEVGKICFASTAPLNLPDSAATSQTFTVDADFTIASLNIEMDITHSWAGDLIASVTHVDTGTTVVLWDRPGVPASTTGTSADLTGGYVFTDTATTAWENLTSFPAGEYRPVGSLASFNGQSVAGTWRLNVSDNAGADVGTVARWAVCIVAEDTACPADFNADTTPGDIFDLFDFLAALDGGLDFNGDTSPADIFDLFDFLAVLDAGCP